MQMNKKGVCLYDFEMKVDSLLVKGTLKFIYGYQL